MIFRIFENNGFTPKTLDPHLRIKAVIYNSHNMVKFEGNYPDGIKLIDNGVYSLLLSNCITKHFSGDLKIEIAIYSSDMALICKEKTEMHWEPYVIGSRIYED